MSQANLKARWQKHTLEFKRPGGTSRGVLKVKESWFIILHSEDNPSILGIGECGLLKGLSCDDLPDYEEKLEEVCQQVNEHEYWLEEGLTNYPSIRFGLEMALLDLQNDGNRILYPSEFTQGKSSIEINGLIWMGEPSFMHEQIEAKLEQGYSCIKMKIGAIDFEQELALLQSIRKRFSRDEIELRVDANGAFSPADAPDKLRRLAVMDLHSIEQPIRQGQAEEMAMLCRMEVLDIALDEELIGIHKHEEKKLLLETIRPPYIILKPSLVGGFASTREWIDIAESLNIGWWITSALESNIGLNAIAQFTYVNRNGLVHGLGTGQLFTNNFDSPLYIHKGHLHFDTDANWDLEPLLG